jgi:hypothetical protein
MSRYISRTFRAHWTRASRSSFWIRPSVRRQRSFARSRIVSAESNSGSDWSSSARRPLPRSRAFSRFFWSTLETSAASSSSSSAPESSASSTLLMCFVTAPFFEPVAFAASLNSGRSASSIWIAAVATCSSSRFERRRSSRIAALRTSSRIFLESSVVIWLAT